MRVRAADIAEQRKVGRIGRCLGDGEADAEDRVRAEAFLVLGSVEFDHRGIDEALVCGLESFDRRADLVEYGVDGLQHAFAQVSVFVAVTKLVRLECTGRCAGRHCGTADRAIFEQDLDLNGRVPTRIQNLASAYSLDLSHNCLLVSRCGGGW